MVEVKKWWATALTPTTLNNIAPVYCGANQGRLYLAYFLLTMSRMTTQQI